MSDRPDRRWPDRRWVDQNGRVIDEEDRGLVYDLQTLVDRRRVLGLFGGISAAGLLAACSGGSGGSATTATSAAASSAAASSAAASSAGSGAGLVEIPDETAGPFPGDGSNGIDVLDDSGIVRADIRSSFGSSTTTAQGVPLTVRLTVRDAATGDVRTGAGVYLWHCDRDGNYSLYSEAAQDENYLRGVQEVDGSGTVTFSTIFPGCYSGRWPHIHFEVFRSLAAATSVANKIATSQIALPKATNDLVYAAAGYEASIRNAAGVSLASDNVFSDGSSLQLATMSGGVAEGYTATLSVAVPV